MTELGPDLARNLLHLGGWSRRGGGNHRGVIDKVRGKGNFEQKQATAIL